MRNLDIDDLHLSLEVEQMLLAWTRTGLGLMAFGFLVARLGVFLRTMVSQSGVTLVERPESAVWVGASFLFLGAAVSLSAVVRHKRHTTAASANARASFPLKLAILVALLTSVFGLMLAGYVLLS